jgi:chemotaxis protein CheX
VTDLVGEITNMVTGGAKHLLAERGYDIGMAVPMVLSGPGHRIQHQVHGPKIVIPFAVERGAFFVEICFGKT